MSNFNQPTSRTVGLYIRTAVKGSGGLTQKTRLLEFLTGTKSHPLYQAKSRMFVDDGFSGMNLNRPGITKLLAAVKAKEIDAVIITDMNRLARSPFHLHEILTFLEKSKCELWDLATGLKIGSGRDQDLCLGGGLK